MEKKESKGIGLILFGILLCVSGPEINNTLFSSIADMPFAPAGLLVGIFGLVLLFQKEAGKKDR